jgi:ABC-2 type transport system ATP-binding protein
VSEVRDLIRELKGQHTIILSTHILPEVQAICERIVIIHKGKIVAQDSLENLSHTQSGGRKIIVRVRKASPDLPKALATVGGVIRVVPGAGTNEWHVDAQAGEEIIEAVAGEVIKKGFGLLEISSAKADLEDIFLKLTYGESKPLEGRV